MFIESSNLVPTLSAFLLIKNKIVIVILKLCLFISYLLVNSINLSSFKPFANPVLTGWAQLCPILRVANINIVHLIAINCIKLTSSVLTVLKFQCTYIKILFYEQCIIVLNLYAKLKISSRGNRIWYTSDKVPLLNNDTFLDSF